MKQPYITYQRECPGRWLIVRDKNTLGRQVIGVICDEALPGERSVLLTDLRWSADGRTLSRETGAAVMWPRKYDTLGNICHVIALRIGHLELLESSAQKRKLPRLAMRGGRWFCTGERCEGSAAAPKAAYDIWKRYEDSMEVRVVPKLKVTL